MKRRRIPHFTTEENCRQVLTHEPSKVKRELKLEEMRCEMRKLDIKFKTKQYDTV